MTTTTRLHETALQVFATDTTTYLRGITNLATALEDDHQITATLLIIFTAFVADAARTTLHRATEAAAPTTNSPDDGPNDGLD